MKILCFAFLIVFNLNQVYSQAVGIGTSLPNSSSVLELNASNKGLLIPRTSTSSRVSIVGPAKGLMIYDTTTASFWYYNASTWKEITTANNGWNLNGNAGVNAGDNFIGTTDEQPLRFRLNNAWAGELQPNNGNIFFGAASGNISTTGEANTAVGDHALNLVTNANFDAAFGYYALAVNSTGFSNTAMGAYALSSNVSGSQNTAIGRNALFANTSGSSNTAVGTNALLSAVSSINNTAVGSNALYSNTTGSQNTAIGLQSLYSNKAGIDNVAAGYQSLYANTDGFQNTATGLQSLYSNTLGYQNTATGYQALYYNISGANNTAIGYSSLAFNNASGNTAVGSNTLVTSTSIGNTAVGNAALMRNTTGPRNTALGSSAGGNNYSGEGNTAAGSEALSQNSSGSFNTAIGANSLTGNLTGSYNVAVGYATGTGGSNPGAFFNTIGIGNRNGFLNGQSNQAIIGDASMVFIGGKVNWGVVSDERIKNNVKEDVKGLEFILRLRPVTYHISNAAIDNITGNKDTINYPGKLDGERIKYSGFLAQEIEAAAKASGYDFSGYSVPKNSSGLYTVKYAEFVVPLVKAAQEMYNKITMLEQQNALLLDRLNAIEKQNQNK